MTMDFEYTPPTAAELKALMQPLPKLTPAQLEAERKALFEPMPAPPTADETRRILQDFQADRALFDGKK